MYRQAIHLARLSFQHQAEFAAEFVQTAEHVFDTRGKNVLAPNDDHVVHPAVDAGNQGGVGAAAGAVNHVPAGDVARPVADHRLGGAFGV